MHRAIILSVAVWFGLSASGLVQASIDLPIGVNPPALGTPHFPNRLHAFVWRNWQLVELQRMAQLVGTSVENIEQIALSMGLPKAAPISATMRERGYITLIRRNWHLLPYDQLLTLLEMSAEELAYTLREDDFLFVKLGRLKPKCEPLRYQEPDLETRQRAAEIKRLVQHHFGDLSMMPAKPRFGFVETLSSLEGTREQGDRTSINRDEPLRMVYSYFGIFGDPLVDPDIDPFPEGLLARLAASGVNGLWMHVVLRQLAPGGEDFPEFGEGHQQRLRTLKKLVEKAKRYGIGIYLYINEPRAMPPTFFENRPDMAGVREGDFLTMCTVTHEFGSG